MLPDNKDALKHWLVETLNPICEADPETLANYVLALIKKDKSEDDLVEACNKNLKDFLREHTKEFVDQLFSTLRSKEYLFGSDKRSSNPQASQKLVSSPTRLEKGQTVYLTSYKSLPKRDQEQIRPKEFEQATKSRWSEKHNDSGETSSGARDKSSGHRHERRQSKSPSSRNRKDTSKERPGRKERTRSKVSDISRSHRDPFSPPLRLGKRSYTRSLSRSVDRNDRESVDPEPEKRSTRESSGSLSPDHSSRTQKRNRTRGEDSPRRDEQRKKQRCRMYYERGFCELGDKCPYDHGENPVLLSNRDFMPNASLEYTPPSYLSQQGQGPPSGAPHLLHQPTVLPNMSQPPPALPYQPHRLPPPHFLPQPGNPVLLPQTQMRPLMPYPMPLTHRPPPPIYQYMQVPTNDLQQDVYQPVDPYMAEQYSPKPSRFSVPPPPIQGQPPLVKGPWKEGESDLEDSVPSVRQVSNLVHVSIEEGKENARIGVSKVDGTDQQGYEVVTSGDNSIKVPAYTPTPSSVLMARKRSARAAGLESPAVTGPLVVLQSSEDAKLMPPPTAYVKKTVLEHPGIPNRNQSPSNTTLELRKIPREDNTIANINDHFSKYGIIVNLQVSWDNDPCAALVSYASSAQALAAYRSKEPFLNNRFIKIFWHNPDKSQQHTGALVNQNSSENKMMEKEFKPKQKLVFPQRHQLHLNRIRNKEEPKKLESDDGSISGSNTTEQSAVDTTDASGPKTSTPSDNEQQPSTKVANSSSNPTNKVTIPPPSALKLQRKPSREMQKSEMLKKGQELIQKQQELLTKLLETQRDLIGKIEKTKNSDEKVKYSQLLKNNDVRITEIRGEMKKGIAAEKALTSPTSDAARRSFYNLKNKYSKAHKLVRTLSDSGNNQLPATPDDGCDSTVITSAVVAAEKDKIAVQKAILDGELDLINNSKNKAVADVLKREISDLKKELSTISKDDEFSAMQGSSTQSSTFPKFNYVHPTSRGSRPFIKASRSVDRRTRQILVTGFQTGEDMTLLLKHMNNFGQVEKSLCDEKLPFFLVTYKYRSDAEKAMKEGSGYNDMKLKLTWHNSDSQHNQSKQTPTNQATTTSKPQSLPSTSSFSSTHIHLGMVNNKLEEEQMRVSDGDDKSAVTPNPAEAMDKDDGDDIGQGDHGTYDAALASDGYVDDGLNEYRRWGLETEVDEEALLGYDEEDEEDDDEGVRPWRR